MRKVKKVAAILGGVASVGAVAIGSVGLASVGFPSGPGPAHAGPPGFSTSSTSAICQGNSPNCNPVKNTNNNGTVSVEITTEGPKGALKNSNTPDNKVTVVEESCGPGKGKCG